MTYELTVYCGSELAFVRYPRGFDQLSEEIDGAMSTPGFSRYEVRIA